MSRLNVISVGALGLLLGLGLTACGEGPDPYDVTSNSNDIPALGLPMEAAKIGSVNTPATRDRLDLAPNNSFNVVAPVNGYVSAITTDGSTYAITLFYNSSFSLQISSLATIPFVRLGERVAAGQILGTVTSFGVVPIYYTALVKGVASCPYPYLAISEKNAIRALTGGFAPCP